METLLRLGITSGAGLALGWAVQSGLRLAFQRWQGRRAAARGARGERRARVLLERAGYRILAEQPRHLATLEVAGRGEDYLLVPDFLCERGGRRYVADAKTGAGADPSARATRRQLLEYACAFEVEDALLIDVNRGRIVRLRFGVLTPRRARGWGWLLAALGLAAAWGTLSLPEAWERLGGPSIGVPRAQGLGQAPR